MGPAELDPAQCNAHFPPSTSAGLFQGFRSLINFPKYPQFLRSAMRRVSTSLLSHLIKPKFSSQNTIAIIFSQILKPPTPFPKCPRIQTLSLTAPTFSSLESFNTKDEIFATFKALDSYLKRNSATSPDDFLKALDFTLRALKIFEGDEGNSISVVKALSLLGLISCKLKKFQDSLESLDMAITILDRLGIEGFDDSEISIVRLEVWERLVETNSEMGRKWDALISLKKVLEVKKSIFDHDSIEMGALYKDLAEAYAVVSEFNEALSSCLKALEIFEMHYGNNSVEVARVRQLIGVIYVGLDEHDKALQQNELALGILRSFDLKNESLDLEIEAVNLRISMGRPGEAIEILKNVIQKVEKESELRAYVFVSMAKALCSQDKFGESKRCLEIACGILNKWESELSSKVYETYAEISLIYEMMNEFEMALSLMKRTLMIVGRLPRQKHLEGSISARMGWLFLLTGRVIEAIPYLEMGEQGLRDSFGKMHFGLGFVNKHLGQSYLEVGKPALAVTVLETAYNILARWFGPHHEDTIDACQCLANAYATKASFSQVEMKQSHYASAMEFQQRVIKAWESHGTNTTDELREAHRLYEQLKRKAQGSPSAVFPANTLPLSHNKEIETMQNAEARAQN